MGHDIRHAMIQALNRGRRYASFFEWPDKDLKELGVVEELVASIAACDALELHEPRINRPDPPDCVCSGACGTRVAVEVAEIVCQRAAALNAQGHNVYRNWYPGELEPHIATRLANKDSKQFHGGPYDEVLICLFTDEPALTSEFAGSELAQTRFGPFRQITRAYLLFSYDPNTKRYPALRLAIDCSKRG